MKLNVMARTLACALVLAGCGGTERVNTAEGFWVGTTDNGNATALVVLEDGQAFGLSSSSAGDVIYNGLYGSVIGSDSEVHGGSGNDFNFIAQTNSSITYAGTVSTKSSLSLSTSSGIKFSGTYHSSFDQVPVIAAIVGTYSGFGITGLAAGATQPMPMTIDGNGNITFTVADCVGAGVLSPRGGSRNVFNLRITLSGVSCAIGNGVQTIGVVIRDTNVTPARLYVMSVDQGTDNAFYWTGT